MPYLDLSGSIYDPFFLLAAMAYPDNEQSREEFIAASVYHAEILASENDDCITTPSNLLRVILNAPSYETVMERLSSTAHGGATAGDILLYIAEMKLTGHEEPSVRKAVYATERYMNNAINANGKKGSCSEVSIRKNWEKYKPVAHLWAAMRMFQFQEENPHSFEFGAMLESRLDEFLATAECFRLFGESFSPPRLKNKVSILPKGETWLVPEDYSLPTMYVSISEMHNDLRECLKEYKAPVNINN